VPSEGNPLADILLSRGVNGESPLKKRPPKKSIRTPKPHSSASRTKTPRTGASKRAPSKSTRVGDENYPPSMKKPRGMSRTPKLQVSERTNGALLRQVNARRLTHLAPCVLRIIYITVRPHFIFPYRHGRWYFCRSLATSRCCPAEALCRRTRRCQCVPLHTQT
jgi:hypothetical protein